MNSLSSVALALLLVACGGDNATDEPDAGTSADAGTEEEVADASPADAATSTPDADLSPDAGPPNGSVCTSADECGSGVCSLFPFLGGQCGECKNDSDCSAGGCTKHSPYDTVGSVCNAGAAGDGCELDGDACQQGLTCGTVFSLLGLVEVSTCGACESDADCLSAQAANCTPIFDTTTFEGQSFCLASNSLSLNDYCDYEGNGDVHCASNHCVEVDAAQLAEVGACGECDTDADCPGEETCAPGTYDLMGTGELVGTTCQ